MHVAQAWRSPGESGKTLQVCSHIAASTASSVVSTQTGKQMSHF